MKDLVAYVDTKEAEILAFLERIVNIDSGTHDKAGVDQVGNILADKLQELGFEVEKVPQTQYGDHLIARKQGRGQRSILFIGHMDTVFPAGTAARRPFRVEGGRAYGPGARHEGWRRLASFRPGGAESHRESRVRRRHYDCDLQQ
jgi:glutamate carboxypeptidase